MPNGVPLAEGRGGIIMFIDGGGGMLIGGIPTVVPLAEGRGGIIPTGGMPSGAE